MTISSQTRKAGPFVGNDSTTAFPFAFKVFTAADMYVVKTDVDLEVETVLVLNTDYTVSLNADQNANPGGTITLPSALVSGFTLTVTSNISPLQQTDLTNQGGFYPSVITNALDKLTILVQQALDSITRSLKLPVSTPSGVSTTLPLPSSNKLIGWNQEADGLQNVDPATLATIVAFGTTNADVFDGDGVTTQFNLSANPAALNNLDVSIGGVTQIPGVDYTWSSGTVITFTSAPPVGTDNVLVRYMQGLPQGYTDSAASTYLPEGSGAVTTTVQTQLRLTTRNAANYDTLANFFAGASGHDNFIPAGTYTLTSLLNIGSLSNCVIRGVPGQTKITGSFGYGLILFASLTDVVFEGITFESTYTNAAASANTAVVYGVSVNNVRFNNCTFTSPNANTQGFVVFARTSAGDTSGIIDGLWIENCKFIDIGQTAITLMNRGTASDKYQAARRVFVRSNYASNLGINNSYGFFISLDGYGSEFEVSGNIIENCYLTAIENVGWWHGEIRGNKFRATTSHTKAWRAITLDGASFGGIQNVSVKDNKLESDATVPSYAWDCSYCDFSGNVWTFTEAAKGFDEAFKVVDCNYNTFTGETYRSDDKYALRLMIDNGNCKYNQFVNCIADTSASAANTAVVNFDGATTTNNEWDGYLVKGSGGSTWTQTNSAANNLAGYDEIGTWTPGLTFATPGNLSVSLTSTGRYTRQGRLVTVTFELDTSSFTHTTASGNLQITGLPFTPNSVTLYYGSLGAFRGITKAGFTQFQLRSVNGQTYLLIYASGSAQVPANLTASDTPTGGTVSLYGSITYEIA